MKINDSATLVSVHNLRLVSSLVILPVINSIYLL